GDEMQLVLDDEIRRTHADDRLRGDGRERTLLVVPVRAARLLVQVVMTEAVPVAAAADASEEDAGVALPRELGEFVHGGDDEARRVPVDLLVDRQDRESLVPADPAGERARVAFAAGAVEDDAA